MQHSLNREKLLNGFQYNYIDILEEIDIFFEKTNEIFHNIWNNYSIEISSLLDEFIVIQKEYQTLLKRAGEAIGLSLDALLGAVQVWLETKDAEDETVRKVGKWGAAALGIAGLAAAGYGIYQMYKSQKKIEELKTKIPHEIAKLQQKKLELLELKINHLNEIKPHILYFKKGTLIIVDVLYSLAEYNASKEHLKKEIIHRVDKTIKFFLEFQFILNTIDFLNKNKFLFINSSYFNPGIPLYIKEKTLSDIREIIEFLSKKYSEKFNWNNLICLLYTSPSPRD